jgi:hypothetical protein
MKLDMMKDNFVWEFVLALSAYLTAPMIDDEISMSPQMRA